MKITKKQLKRLIRESIGIPHSLQVLEDKEDRIMSFINGQLLSPMGASDDINVSIEDLLSLRNDIDSIREKEGMPAKDYSRPYLYAAENAIKQYSRRIKNIKEELKKGPYGYDGADQTTYEDAYQQIMDLVAELGYAGPHGEPDPKVLGAIYNALTGITKELEQSLEHALTIRHHNEDY